MTTRYLLFGWLLSFSLLLGFACQSEPTAAEAETAWTPLFNGTDLSGWEVKGGNATFYVEDSVIVGLTEDSLPNCFLATTQTFDDFELMVEFKIDPEINSGVQVRSNHYDRDTTTTYLSGSLEEGTHDWEKGRVYGYQIEIDPSKRAWTGGLYEEGGRGWLQPLTQNEPARQAFRPGDWNQFRIRAEGPHFQSWLNGVPAADTTDQETASGFIGLQLHGAWKEAQVGQKVYFRGIKVRELE